METGLSRVLLMLTLLPIAAKGLGESVFLSLGSINIFTNNTEVLITDIGQDVPGELPSLTCHTDLRNCCRAGDTGSVGMGEWYYPDGRVVQNTADATASGERLLIVRNAPQVIRLARRASNPLTPTGSYCCVIPTTGGEMTFCANIVVCPSLPPLTNGMISYNDSTLGVDSVATHSCDTGYTLNGGNTTRNCQSDGIWSGLAPTCEVACKPLTDPMNGMVSINNFFGNAVATYSCDAGYALNGESTTRTCQSDETWSGSAPTCNVACFDLSSLFNGVISYKNGSTDHRPVGTVATYSCDAGYTLNGGSTTRTCQSDGNWSKSAPTCRAVDCGAPTNPSKGMVSFSSTIFESTANYSCDSGYTLDGVSIRFCGASGKWTRVEPTCKPVSCGLPPPIPNGSPGTPTSTTFGGTVLYSCDAGYERSGPAVVTCEASGSWSTVPGCELITCMDLPLLVNGVVSHHGGSTDSRPVGTVAMYSCNAGYTLDGGSIARTCQKDGTWNGAAPTCKPPPVYLSFSSNNYLSGLSEIPLSSMREGGDQSLICHTDLDEGLRDGLGNWYYPNGSVVSEEGGLYVTRGDQMVSLNLRTSAQPPGGLYCCVVPTSASKYDTACIVLGAPQSEISSSPLSVTIGAVVGGVVAMAIIVVGVVFIVYLLLRHKRTRTETALATHNFVALTAQTTGSEANTFTPDDKAAPCYEELSFSSHRKTGNCTFTRNESYHLPEVPVCASRARGGGFERSNPPQDEGEHQYSTIGCTRTN